MPQQETGKQRASRIPLDYFKAANPLERWKARLGWLAVIVPVAWLGSNWVLSREADLYASRGPVAGVHQGLDKQCSACHRPFQAINSHSWVPPFLGDSSGSDQACMKCHAGPIHHANQTGEPSCAACHREHRGVEASLLRSADRECTHCHRSLQSIGPSHLLAPSDTPIAKSISRFDVDHPPFRSLRSDPGRLQFNHQRHMTKGIPAMDGGQTGGPIWKYKDVPAEYRSRYKALNRKPGGAEPEDDAYVQLDCRACHQLDRADFPVTKEMESEVAPGLVPPRSPGAYFLPITYENQCKACHPLGSAQLLPNGKLVEVPIPHRLQPKEVISLLRDHLTAKLALGQPGFLIQKIEVPLPGKGPGGNFEKTIGSIIDRAEKELFQKEFFQPGMKKNCALCHEFTASGTDRVVVPPSMPLIWLKHAEFNHNAHRTVGCTDCHPAADTSRKTSDVLVPDRDNCLKCHARQPAPGIVQSARFHCVECHRYHNADHPEQGVAALARRPQP